MLEIIREYSFDVNFEAGKFKRTDGSTERIKLIQNDNESTKFKFNFEEEIADNTNVLVRLRQSTGYVKEYTMLIQNQKAEIILTNDILSESGSLTMSITLIGTDDEILTDTEYHSKIQVIASLEGNTEIPEQEKSVLVDLISQVNSLNQTASQLVEDTETAVTNSSTVLANAETALQNANTATSNANQAAQNANNAVTELDNRLAAKVDKVNGKDLSTNDFSNEYKQKVDTLENYDDTEINEDIEELQEENEKLKEKIKELEEDVDRIETTRGHIYGVRRKITNNSSSAWERLFDSIGKTATATKNGGTVQNDFDNLAPWSDIKSCNYDLTTKKINAWFGDANFAFDGTNGDVFTHIPKTYWKIYQENDYDYVLLADYPRAGFMEVDGFFIGRYNASVVSDVLHSYSGLVPTTNKTIGQFRTLANALGTNFSQLDWRYFVLQMLYLVEYANYNSQSMLGNGVMNRKYLKTLVAENNTNRAIIGSSSGYYVGQIIRIGTSDGGTQIADARKITAIEAYDEDGVTGAALTFDGAAVNIAVDNFVCTMAQITGQCDDLGMKSGCINNNGYHSMIYRGVENLFANIWQFVDGINIKDRLAYICKDHSQYADNVFADPYKPLAYTNADANGYAKTLGLDVDEPFFRFPTEVGGSTSTYMADYYYQNTGNRVALVGGTFNDGAADGLWYWNFGSGSSGADWNVGCRVLIDNQ